MRSRPLMGITVAGRANDAATTTCVRHLERLGATIAEAVEDADVVLDPEAHELLGGGLVASEATAQAALGLTDYIGPAGGRPARTGCDVASSVAGFCGALVTLAHLHADRNRPFSVSLSPLRALATLKTILWAARTRPDEWSGTHVRSRERLVDSGYGTRDRRITLDFPFNAESSWLGFAGELGLDPATIQRLHGRWYESVGWGDDVDEARPLYETRLGELPSNEAINLIRRHGGSSVPFLLPEECLDHPQARALGLRESLERGLPWRLEARDDSFSRVRRPSAAGAPLAGIRVVDLGVGGVGPFAAALLAWLGADVVKVEAPNEFILTVRPTVRGLSTTYLALNQGKRSVSLDLKDERDRALVLELLAGADVLIENFRPGALDRLGLGFEDVATLNPGIVYCSATGFGWDGPLAREACTDPHMQAFSGFAWLNAEAGLPRRVRYYGFVDLVTSCVIAEAACAALLARDRTGGAVRIETSMLHAVMEAQQSVLTGSRPALDGLFPTADGYLAITCRDEEERRRFTNLVGQPDALQRWPAAAWAHTLGRAGIPCARASHDEEAMSRLDLWDWGVLRKLPLCDAPPLVAGGTPWPPDQTVGAPTAPVPGGDTQALRARPASFWHESPFPIGEARRGV